MHDIYELKEKLLKELEEYGRKGVSTGSLDVVDKLAHTIKNLCKILEESDGYSSRYDDGHMTYRGSYARGRRNAKRDTMGRYSSNGYSYGSEEMVDQLEDLMADAPEQVKQDIQRLINKVEKL